MPPKPDTTHRLLAQHVKLIRGHGTLYLVEYPDGSQGLVTPDEIVSVEAVRQDQASRPREE